MAQQTLSCIRGHFGNELPKIGSRHVYFGSSFPNYAETDINFAFC